MRFLTTSVLIPGSRAASPRKTGTIVLQFALVYYWCKELATLPRGFNQFADSAYPRRIMRADERTRTAYPCSSYECALTHSPLFPEVSEITYSSLVHLFCVSGCSPTFARVTVKPA